MNTKRFVLTFVLVFVLLEVTNFIIHGGILGSAYKSETLKTVFRPENAMMKKMWIMYIVDVAWSFFFVFFFVKGYEGKGIMEGVRFGAYIGLFWSFVNASQSYVVYQIPYSLPMQWIIYGFIQSVILGIVASYVYKPQSAKAPVAAVA